MRQADPARSRLAREKRLGRDREGENENKKEDTGEPRTAELASMSLCPITNKTIIRPMKRNEALIVVKKKNC